jgi:hypothetical protein
MPISRRLLLGLTISALTARVAAQRPSAARELRTADGLRFEVPAHLDLTYQVVPSYDETERVIAAWHGERLQFIVASSELPAGYTDAQAYHAGMARDLRAAWEQLAIGRSANYRTTGSLNGAVVEYIKRSTDPDRASTILFQHLLSDGRVSHAVTVAVVPPASAARVYEDSMALLRTAALSGIKEPVVRAEDAFVGVWTSDERLPDGRIARMRVEFKADLSFATRVSIGEQLVLDATGVWGRSANKLHWTYLYSQPPLPARHKEDVDIVVAADRDLIILRSTLSAKERSLRRVTGAAR